jgi:hypothetical protein
MREVLGHVTLDDRGPRQDDGDDADGDKGFPVSAEHVALSLRYPVIKALPMQDLELPTLLANDAPAFAVAFNRVG